MSYGYSIDDEDKGQFPKVSQYCREQLQRTIHKKQQKTDRGLSKKVVKFSFRYEPLNRSALTRDADSAWFSAAAKWFSKQLLDKLGKYLHFRENQLKMDFSKTSSGAQNFRVSMPALVLKNPQFSSFYLGILRHIADVSAQKDKDKLDYTGFSLGKFLRMLNEQYDFREGPTYNYPERKLKAFLVVYEKKDYLKEFFSAEE